MRIKVSDFFVKKVTALNEIKMVLEEINESINDESIKVINNIEEYAKKLFENAIIYVAYKTNNLGFIIFYANNWCTKTAYITKLVINKEKRREHVGTILLELSIIISKVLGMKMMKLEVNTQNKDAISFYEHNGFSIISKKSNDSIYMMKVI